MKAELADSDAKLSAPATRSKRKRTRWRSSSRRIDADMKSFSQNLDQNGKNLDNIGQALDKAIADEQAWYDGTMGWATRRWTHSA